MRFINSVNLLNFCFAVLLICNCAFSVACQKQEEQIASSLEKCHEFLDKDNVEEAGLCYQREIVAHPSEAARISKLGEEAVFKKCLEYKEKKDFQKSIICLEGVVGLRGDSANVHFQLGDSYFQYYLQDQKKLGYADNDLLHRAEASIKRSLEIDSEKAITRATYGEILERKGDLRGALREYRQAVKFDPKFSLYWIKLALVQEKMNDSVGALESYQNALKINPNDTDALYFLGAFYEKNGRVKEAIEILERRNKLETPNEETLQKLNELKRKLEDIKSTPPKSKTKTAGV